MGKIYAKEDELAWQEEVRKEGGRKGEGRWASSSEGGGIGERKCRVDASQGTSCQEAEGLRFCVHLYDVISLKLDSSAYYQIRSHVVQSFYYIFSSIEFTSYIAR